MQRISFLAVFAFHFLATTSVSAQALPELTWSKDGKQFVYQVEGKSFLGDVEAKTRTPLKDSELPPWFQSIPRLSLPPLSSVNGGASTTLRVENGINETIEMLWVDTSGRKRSYGNVEPGGTFRQQTYVGHAWLLQSKGKNLGSFRCEPNEKLVVDRELLKQVSRRKRNRPQISRGRNWKRPSNRSQSPDRQWKAKVLEHNLWINDTQLTTDGKEEHTFLNVGNGTFWNSNAIGPDVRWSPDSRYIVAFKTLNPRQPRVHFVESTPSDQLQPRLQNYGYPKPGDQLPQKTLRLFSAEEAKEISVSNELFENPWSLRFVRWTDDGKKFWLHYNQRGHQVVRLIEVELATGEARTLIEESVDTFVHYSNGTKSTFKPLPDNKILWGSERTGWNHLYRFDQDGKLVNAITKGDWNVKRIDRIDEKSGRIWFYAVGVHKDQDPYHEHYCRVNFDGSNFKTLTDGDGTHQIRYENDDQFLVDEFSRVDMAPVTQLRDAESGELLFELRSSDTTAAFGQRQPTTRFSAKGRDGETDIWGIIHWPRDFDAAKKYPVVEQIYAGPHDHHVPKRFRSNWSTAHRIADAGMVVVQIDGMGTAWRSKKFHDVCYKNLRDAGFPDRIAWMKAAAKKYPQMDVSRVGIFGGSAGGQNAMAALLWHNDFYKVAVADCGCHDNRMDKIWWNEQWMGWPVDDSYIANSNMENAHLLKGKLMLTVGEMDRNVDPATTTQVVKKLIDADKDFEFVLLPGKGHGAGESAWAAKKRLNFLKQNLSK